jgi:formyl-CoA transferase
MSMAEQAAGPLEGLRVVELGSVVSGPFCTRLLADLGAEVIKVETPQRPDPLRDWGRGSYHGHKLWWPLQSRNKKLITCDLSDPAGQDLLLRLAVVSDVLVENFRPGTLERWNLGYERLAEANRGLILARVSGYGQTGPYRDQAGYASVAEAMGGLRYINGHPGQAPPRMGISLGDELAGMFACQGILAALHWREHGGAGQGQVVDVSLLESCYALLESTVPEYDLLGLVRQPSGSRLPGIAPSNVFATADERWVVIAANQDTVFARLAEAMGRPELATDARYATHDARGEHQDELEELITAWARGWQAEELINHLTDAGVVAGPLYTAADLVTDPQLRERGMLARHDDPELGTSYLGPGVVPKLSATPGTIRWTGRWQPGEHNREIYTGLLGLDADELDDLGNQGVL